MGVYVPSTTAEQKELLSAVGLNSLDELYQVVPKEALVSKLELPAGKSELEVVDTLSKLANKNQRFQSVFRGAGAYRHYIPAIVQSITSKEEFRTAYTPYQAEISQGVLQSIFEYQTQICELTGMEVSNASLYDGASAAAEAVLMCQERKRQEVIISATVDPQTIAVVKTYCASRKVPVSVVASDKCATDIAAVESAINVGTAAVLVQSPNYYGVIEDIDAIVSAAHSKGAKLVMSFNPISLGLLKTPGEYGVDVAVGEGQPLGLPLSFGGPYLGLMTCTKKLMRKMPGRIVGETSDAKGRRAFVLTLQAREQHIRREKASSNVCSNEALCAMTASVYLAAMGPKGIYKVAQSCTAHAHYLQRRLQEIPGFTLRDTRPFFHEFLTNCPSDTDQIIAALSKKGILAGLPVDGGLLWCCTELNSREQIDLLIAALKEVSGV